MLDTISGAEYIRQYKWTKVADYIKKHNRYIFDNHHVEPISLWWHDMVYNIQEIRRPMHDMIHDILNIPMRSYTKWTRKIREKTNHKLVHTTDYVRMMAELQYQYFSKLDKLPKEVVNMHENKMYQNVEHRQSVANDFIQYDKMEEQEDFATMHKHKNRLREMVAEEIQSTLKGKYYNK